MLVGRLPPLSPRLRARPAERFCGDVERQFRLLRRALNLRTSFLQVAAGDCALARRVAGYVERAYAVGPLRGPHFGRRAPNLVAVLADGGAVPVPEGSIDVAFSDGLLERLQPAAVREHLAAVRRSLARGGSYFCISAQRAARLREQLMQAGFRTVRFYWRIGSRLAIAPYPLLRLAEAILAGRPSGLLARASP